MATVPPWLNAKQAKTVNATPPPIGTQEGPPVPQPVPAPASVPLGIPYGPPAPPPPPQPIGRGTSLSATQQPQIRPQPEPNFPGPYKGLTQGLDYVNATNNQNAYLDRSYSQQQIDQSFAGQRGFWENPQRVARYYLAAKTLPDGAPVPDWMDVPKLEAAFDYLRQSNNNKPWWQWDYRSPQAQEYKDFVNGLQVPPLDAMPADDRKTWEFMASQGFQKPPAIFYPFTPFAPGQKMTDLQINKAFPAWMSLSPDANPQRAGPYANAPAPQLPVPTAEEIAAGTVPFRSAIYPGAAGPMMPKQRQVVNITIAQDTKDRAMQSLGLTAEQYDALPGWQKWYMEHQEAMNYVTAGAVGAIPGFLAGGPIGAAVGAGIGMVLAGAGTTVQPLAQAFNWYNQNIVENVERSVGFSTQVIDSLVNPGQYGELSKWLQDKDAIHAAWLAGSAAFLPMFGGGLQGQYQGYEGITTLPAGVYPSGYVMSQARLRILNGENPDLVMQDVTRQFGVSGQIKEMIGHIVMDPMNLLAVLPEAGTAFVAGLQGNELLLHAATATHPGWFGTVHGATLTEALKEYGASVRRLAPEEAARYGSLTRWLADLDEAGHMNLYSNQRPRNPIDYLRGLTPQARASEATHDLVDGMKIAMSTVQDPSEVVNFIHAVANVTPEESVHAMQMSDLPTWLSSAEAQPLSAAIKDAVPIVDELYDQWKISDPMRKQIVRMAEAMSTEDVPVEPEKIIAQLHNAKPDEVENVYRSLLEGLKERIDQGTAAGQDVKSLKSELDYFLRADYHNMKKSADLFAGSDSIPFRPEEFKYRTLVAMADGVDHWAADWFGVKPAHWAIRLSQVVKQAQGLAVLGLNPIYLLNNGINNMVTMAWDGLFSTATTAARRSWLKDMELNPTRLRSGMSAAEIGAFGEDLKFGMAIHKAGQGADWIQSLHNKLTKTNRLAVMANWSQKIEQYSSEMAMTNTMREFWERTWTAGNGFDYVPGDLKLALDAVQPGLSDRVEGLIARGKNRTQIEAQLFQGLGRTSIEEVLSPEEKQLFSHFPALLDDLNSSLQNAKSDTDVHAAFTDVRQKAQDQIKSMIADNMRKVTEESTIKAKIEGTGGVLDMIDNTMRHDFWLEHFEIMDEVASEADKYSGAARRAIWQTARQERDFAWHEFENIEGSKWLGAFDGLGADDATHVRVLSLLSDGEGDQLGLHSTWEYYYAKVRDAMDNYASLSENMEMDARSQLWDETNQALNREYVQAILSEDQVQGQLDQLFIDQYATQMGTEKARTEAEIWRTSLRDVRRRMAETMVLFRNGGTLPSELAGWGKILPDDLMLRVKQLTNARPVHTINVEDRSVINKEFYQDIYTPYIRELLETSNRHLPGNGMPVEPAPAPISQPPMVENPIAPPPPVAEEVAHPAYLDNQIRLNEMERQRAQVTGVFKIASEHGVGSISSSDQVHILNILKQHFKVDSIEQITPEMAEIAFRQRDLWRGAIDKVRQAELDKRILQYRADEIRKNQMLLQIAAPERFTEEAVAREAINHLGDEQGQALMTLYNQIADYWTKNNPGKTRDDFYNQFIFERGGMESGPGLAQQIQNAADRLKIPAGEVVRHLSMADKARDIGYYQGERLQVSYNTQFLTPDQRIMEARNAEWINDHYDEAVLTYRENMLRKGKGNFLDVDEARELFPEYNHDRSYYSVATHEPASAFIKSLFNDELTHLDPGEMPRVTFMGGGAGAGKSSAAGVSVVDRIQRSSRFVYDGSLSNYDATLRRINQVRAIGDKVNVIFVYRDIVDAMRGMISRADIQARETGQFTGRVVPFESTVDTNVHAVETFLRLYDQFKDNPDFNFLMVDNSGRPEEARLSNIDFLRNKRYTDIEQVINNTWKEVISHGTDNPIYRGITGGRSFQEIRDATTALFRSAGQADQGIDVQGVGGIDGSVNGPGITGTQGATPPDALEQPLKGLTTFLDDGRALVHAYEAADFSTFSHEFIHGFLPLAPEADRVVLETWLRDEYQLDLPPGWERGHAEHVQAKEYIARAFERYLAEGQAPIPTLIKVFENIKQWMLRIYNNITGSQIDVKVTDDVRGMFDKWLGAPAEAGAVPVVEAPVEEAIQVVDFEQFAAARGAPKFVSDVAIQRLPGVSEGEKQAIIQLDQERVQANVARREELRAEYDQLVADGKMRPLTRTERLIETAKGNLDNPSVQAARRVLAKRGISWQASLEQARAEGALPDTVWGRSPFKAGANQERRLSTQQEREAWLGTHNQLTRLPNRTALLGNEELNLTGDFQSRAAAATQAGKEPPTLALVDLRGLHLTNKQFGMGVGDAYIQALGKVLTDAGVDAYHYGGDEFVVLFNTRAEATTAMENITKQVEGMTIDYNGQPLYGAKAHYGLATGTDGAKLIDEASVAGAQIAAEQGYQRGTYRLWGPEEKPLTPETIGATDLGQQIPPAETFAFAQDAQIGQSARFSAMEKAFTDVKAVDTAQLAQLEIGENQTIEGALNSPANADIVKDFLNHIPPAERTEFLDADGALSIDGMTRMKYALFAYVYPGEAGKRIARLFIEDTSPQMRNIESAMFDTLGEMSNVEALVRSGQRDPELAIADDLIKSVDMLKRIKDSAMSVTDYLNQPGLYGEELNPFQKMMIEYLDKYSRSRKSLREMLAFYTNDVIHSQVSPNQLGLFAGARSSKGEILDAATRWVTGEPMGFADTTPLKGATPLKGVTAPAVGALVPVEGALPAQPPLPAAPLAQPMPVGTTDSLKQAPIESAALETWMRDMAPMLTRAEGKLTGQGARSARTVLDTQSVDPDLLRALKGYMGKVYNQMADTKIGAMRYGEMRRNFALLDYTHRTGFDNVAGAILPYEFWMKQSMMNWALRVVDKPTILLNWARLNALTQNITGQQGFPTRLKKKIGIKLPFLPDWMGSSIYVDPMKQVFPFQLIMQPFDSLAQQRNQETKRAETILSQQVTDQQITAQEAQVATQTHTGNNWQQALSQARTELESELQNPLDFAFMVASPSLPLNIAYQVIKGTPQNINQLPVTKMIQNVTSAAGIGGPRGVNIEAPIRKLFNIPEFDKYDEYRVDRMLANLAAEGQITAKDAELAMIDRQGTAFDMASRRVAQMGNWQYAGAPLGVDFFPEGEQDLRNLQTVYSAARDKWASGEDPQALTKFFNDHPEYQVRTASFQDPKTRLQRFLVSEVWDRYNQMPDLWKKQIAAQLGTPFQDGFLNKDTRSYDNISDATLASWAQMMGGVLPKSAPDVANIPLQLASPEVANLVQQYNDQRDVKFPGLWDNSILGGPETEQQKQYYIWRNQFIADHPAIASILTTDQSNLYGLPNEIQAQVYQYRAQKETNYPNVDNIQTAYFAIPQEQKAQRRYFLKTPEGVLLSNYWTWRKQFAAQMPKAAPYILSDTTLGNLIVPGSQPPIQDSQVNNSLMNQLAGYRIAGQPLAPGTLTYLTQMQQDNNYDGDLAEYIEVLSNYLLHR